MATFTWTATGAGTTAWETPAAWFDTVGGTNPSSASFKAFPGNDYVINGSNLFTVNQIGAGGTASPDIANSLTLSDVQATLLLADGGGALDVTTTLSLNSLLNLGTAVGGSVLSMGGTAGGGTISLGSSGRLEGALNDSIQDIGISPTEIIGAGTVIAEGGIFQIGTSVRVAAGATTKFQIDPNATLAFADAVSGGTIVFLHRFPERGHRRDGDLDQRDVERRDPQYFCRRHESLNSDHRELCRPARQLRQ
jgi:hypothetical protein